MMRRTPLKSSGFKSIPDLRKEARRGHKEAIAGLGDAQLFLWMLSREQRLDARAARTLANAKPRAAVVVNAASAAAPVLKDNPLRSEAYRRAVAGLACAHCGVHGFSQHAHANEGKGAGLKTDDRTGFPLCCTRPGIEGCHTAFDQYRLLPGGREAHRAAARTWAANTRAEIQRQGLWPARLPLWNEGTPA